MASLNARQPITQLREERTREFFDALTADEKTLFDAASISESLLKEIESADAEHKDGSFARKASTSVLPFIAGIEQYSKAMDVFANRYG